MSDVGDAELPEGQASVAQTHAPGTTTGDRRLACSQCRQRKIKCNREHPCLPCLSSGRECALMPPPPPRKPRRRNHHALLEKVESLETLLQQFVRAEQLQKCQTAAARSSSAARPSEPVTTLPTRQPPGYLVKTRGGGVEFRDAKVSSHVFQDLQTIKAVLEVEADQETWLPFLPSASSEQLGRRNLTVQECIPTPNEIVVLWGIFLDRVDPVTKIVHVPTFRSRIVNAVADFFRAPLPAQALMFSLFLAASGSLSQREHHDLLGRTKTETMATFTRGFKTVMTQLDYVRNHTVDVLRALIFFSLSRQGPRHKPCDPWIFHGLIVHIAYSLGLHVDGTQVGLTPFEIEMRRRLWWQVVELNVKHTRAAGVGAFLMQRPSNTKLPSNLDDLELHPDMCAIPEEHWGPTEMSFCLMAYEACSLMEDRHPSHNLVDDLILTGPSQARDQATSQKMRLARESLLELIAVATHDLQPLARQRCPDMNNPLHARIAHNQVAMDGLLQIIIRPMQEAPEWGIELHGPEDNYFRITIAAFEFRQGEQQAFGHRFIWYSNINFSLPPLAYMAAQLHHRVSGSLADRAWACVEKAYGYHEALWDLEDKEIMTLGNLVLAAWDRRQGHFQSKGIPLPEPSFLTRLKDEVTMIKVQALSLRTVV